MRKLLDGIICLIDAGKLYDTGQMQSEMALNRQLH